MLAPPEIIEYAHGGTSPKATLAATQGVEPGRLFHRPYNWQSGRRKLVIGGGRRCLCRCARALRRRIPIHNFGNYGFCGYDDDGNLFVDGFSKITPVVIAELPRWKQFKFDTISTMRRRSSTLRVEYPVGRYSTSAIVDRQSRRPTNIAPVQQYLGRRKSVRRSTFEVRMDGDASYGRSSTSLTDGTVIAPNSVSACWTIG